MTDDPHRDIRDAISSTKRLIDRERAVEHGDNDGHDAYIADLEAHLQKLQKMLAKYEDARHKDIQQYGNPH